MTQYNHNGNRGAGQSQRNTSNRPNGGQNGSRANRGGNNGGRMPNGQQGNHYARNNPIQQGNTASFYKASGVNLGLLFDKLLYINETSTTDLNTAYGIRETETGDRIAEKLNVLCSEHQLQLAQGVPVMEPPEELGCDAIKLKTMYPGLYVGLGYSHGVPNSKDDIKNGFSFDYTSGLPVIPASSVKGCLRSCFEEKKEDTLFLLQGTKTYGNADSGTLTFLINRIFEGKDEQKKALPMDDRFVFFDAYPVACSNGLLGTDSITPHGDKGLKEPVPIKMLKVRGGVEWRFPILFPSSIAEQEKADLLTVFTEMLVSWGVGAKTNVGYGNLIEC